MSYTSGQTLGTVLLVLGLLAALLGKAINSLAVLLVALALVLAGSIVIRLTRRCPKCGRYIPAIRGFHDPMEYCPFCGEKLPVNRDL